jgi:hypothetical protein
VAEAGGSSASRTSRFFHHQNENIVFYMLVQENIILCYDDLALWKL